MATIITTIDEFRRIKQETIVRLVINDNHMRIDLSPEQIEQACKEYVWQYADFKTGKMQDAITPTTITT